MQIKDFLINSQLEEQTQHKTVELPIACYCLSPLAISTGFAY